MTQDVRDFISTCPVYAQEKSSTNLQLAFTTVFLLLDEPGHPSQWTSSPLCPSSDGNSTLVTAVDGFSKAVYFNPLSKLPTTTKTVFWLQGFLKYIVSDQGPQLASQAWRAFCGTLGTSVSISSGYHLMFNGQTERTIQSLESALQCMAAQHRASLSLFMPWIEYAVLAGLCCHKNVLIHGFPNIPTTYEF